MKTFTFFCFLVVVYLQIDAWSIDHQSNYDDIIMNYDKVRKAKKLHFEQQLSCLTEVSRDKLRNLPFDFVCRGPEDNDSANALCGCIYMKKEIVNDNSDINKDKLDEYFMFIADFYGKTSAKDLQAWHGMTEECSQVRGVNPGQTAIKINNCAAQYAKRHFRR